MNALTDKLFVDWKKGLRRNPTNFKNCIKLFTLFHYSPDIKFHGFFDMSVYSFTFLSEIG